MFIRSEEPIDQAVVCVADGLGLDIPSEILCSESDSQPGGNIHLHLKERKKTLINMLNFDCNCVCLEEGGSTVGSEVLESEEEGTAAEVSCDIKHTRCHLGIIN